LYREFPLYIVHPEMAHSRKTALALVTLAILTPGCVERTLSIETNPPGAVVLLNDSEFGRTPAQRDFTWYGTYDVVIRKEGYQTIKTKAPVIAPFYEWIPLDLIAQLLPVKIKDARTLKYDLDALPPIEQDAASLLKRSHELQAQLPDPKKTSQ
jgi:hypothetical protein